MNDRKDRIRVHIEEKAYNVVGGEFREMLAAVKQITGRRFVGTLKVWQLPGAVEDIRHQLSISGYTLEGGTPLTESAPEMQAQPSTDRIRIQVGDHQLAVVGGAFQDMLAVVKKLPGRRFDGQTKTWTIPGDAALVKGVIEAAGFQLEGAEQISVEAVPPMEPVPGSEAEAPPPFEPPDFGHRPEAPPYEPPDWWDDEQMPPPVPPPEGWIDQTGETPFEEPLPIDEEPSPFSPPAAAAAPAAAGGDRIRIRLGEEAFVVAGGSFREMLTVIKNIPGRRFNGQEKVWEIPADVTLDSVDQAVSAAGFTLLPG